MSTWVKLDLSVVENYWETIEKSYTERVNGKIVNQTKVPREYIESEYSLQYVDESGNKYDISYSFSQKLGSGDLIETTTSKVGILLNTSFHFQRNYLTQHFYHKTYTEYVESNRSVVEFEYKWNFAILSGKLAENYIGDIAPIDGPVLEYYYGSGTSQDVIIRETHYTGDITNEIRTVETKDSEIEDEHVIIYKDWVWIKIVGALFGEGDDSRDMGLLDPLDFDLTSSAGGALAGNDVVALPKTLSQWLSWDVSPNSDGRVHFDAGAGDDKVTGGALNDSISGDIGNDTFVGAGGDDYLYMGPGADTARGDAGEDWINGEAGDDKLYGGADIDQLDGGADSDILDTGEGDKNYAVGGGGDDNVKGGSGDDDLWGDGFLFKDDIPYSDTSTGKDTLEAGAGDDNVIAGPGDDTIIGGPGYDHVWGDGVGLTPKEEWWTDDRTSLGNDTFDYQKNGFAGFVGGTHQVLFGGRETGKAGDVNGGIDLIKLPGSPGDYRFVVEFDGISPTWTGTKTKIVFESKPSTFYTLETSDIEKALFSSVISNPVTLTAKNITAEMLTLAGEVYGRQETLGDNKRDPLAYEKGYDNTHLVSTPAAARGWHPVSALELGMKPADFGDHGNTKYAFTDGVYAAYTAGGAKLVGTLKGDISEANAMVLTGMVGGTKTLVVTFRGTDQFADFDDYPDFATHYKKFEPLVDGIREYLKGNPVGQVLVSGHSLGAGMVEHFLADFSGDPRFKAFTAGSPGSDTGRADGRITNFVSTDDAIGWVPEFSGAQLKAFGAAVASLVAGKDPVFAAKLLLFLAPLKGKDRSGADVEIDSSVRDPLSLNFKGLNPKTLVDEHAHTLYTSNILKLITFAEDQGGPFSGTKLAQKLLAGEIVPEKNALQIGLGKPTNPKVVGSTFDPKIVAPLTDDNYVLGNNGQNDTFILTKKTLIQTVGRKFDGGTGDGDLVRVPYKLKGVKGDGDVFRVVDNSDGSKTLKYDAKRGKTDKWETVGTFYRTEKIVYGKGDPEKLNDVTKAKSASADHDLMFT